MSDAGTTDRVSTGVAGLDYILGGGLPAGEVVVVEGGSGTGKTTLALQCCIAAAARGETALYISMCETQRELRRAAASHGWSLEGVHVHYHGGADQLDPGAAQTLLHPAEVELPETASALLTVVDRLQPRLVVLDSLTELRSLAVDPRWFRRQIVAFKQYFADRSVSVLVLDDPVQVAGNRGIGSLVTGMVQLTIDRYDYGPARRRLTIVKMRGMDVDDGSHDVRIVTGGLRVYPRLVPSAARGFAPGLLGSGVPELDALLGGGLDRGASLLLSGPAGAGKSTLGAQFALAAARRGERTALITFEERRSTMLQRLRTMGLEMEPYLDSDTIRIHEIDPTDLSPGEFVARCASLADDGFSIVQIDSISGYFLAMRNEQFLILHLSDLLRFLNRMGLTVLLTAPQLDLFGQAARSLLNVSYLADTVILLRFFEAAGRVRRAISVHKRRSGPHEHSIRELEITSAGIRVGGPLTDFQGVLTGVPTYVGSLSGDRLQT